MLLGAEGQQEEKRNSQGPQNLHSRCIRFNERFGAPRLAAKNLFAFERKGKERGGEAQGQFRTG